MAGLIGNPLGTKEKLSNIDLNDLHTSGIYDQTGGTTVLNAPANGSAYRMFIVFKSGSYTVQIAIDNNNNEFRRIFSYGAWSNWG